MIIDVRYDFLPSGAQTWRPLANRNAYQPRVKVIASTSAIFCVFSGILFFLPLGTVLISKKLSRVRPYIINWLISPGFLANNPPCGRVSAFRLAMYLYDPVSWHKFKFNFTWECLTWYSHRTSVFHTIWLLVHMCNSLAIIFYGLKSGLSIPGKLEYLSERLSLPTSVVNEFGLMCHVIPWA